jgi:hypothetical protein
VKDYEGKSLAYVYFEDEAGPAISGASAHPRRGAAHRGEHRQAARTSIGARAHGLRPHDQARRLAA